MHNPRTEARPSNVEHASAGAALQTAAECYAMANQCEGQAATVSSGEVRGILLEVAATWRDLGNSLWTAGPSLH